MKKFTYLLIVLLAFAVTGCEKDEASKKTLEELYPKWKNLTRIATYDNETDVSVDYPRVEYIKIEGDMVKILEYTSDARQLFSTFDAIIIDDINNNNNKSITFFTIKVATIYSIYVKIKVIQ